MAMWPKTIYIQGIGIPVADWDEMDEIVRRYGDGEAHARPDGIEKDSSERIETPRRNGGLPPADHALLERFVDGKDRGVPTSELGPALGKQGKSIRGELERWSRRIGLVTGEGDYSAFEAIHNADGRGFRLVALYWNAAKRMLES